jgi:WD repeat-containing protein 24
VRELALAPESSTPLHAVVALESGTLMHWDLRQGQAGLLDRVGAAHKGAILGLEWLPSGGKGGNGWLATGGMDKTVKVSHQCDFSVCQI